MKLFIVVAVTFWIQALEVLHTEEPSGVVVPEAAPVNDSASLEGDWYLLPALASDTAAGKLPVLRFQLAQKRFSGFTGCNQMSGSFRVLGGQVQFDKDIALTKMECEGYNEKEFIMNLLRVDHYKIREAVLWLMIGQTPVSKWVRKPDNKKIV
jgi:heat shock protein HslJ